MQVIGQMMGLRELPKIQYPENVSTSVPVSPPAPSLLHFEGDKDKENDKINEKASKSKKANAFVLGMMLAITGMVPFITGADQPKPPSTVQTPKSDMPHNAELEARKLASLRSLLFNPLEDAKLRAIKAIPDLQQDETKLTLIRAAVLFEQPALQEALAQVIPSLKEDAAKSTLIDEVLAKQDPAKVTILLPGLMSLQEKGARDNRIVKMSQGNLSERTLSALALSKMDNAALRDPMIKKMIGDTDSSVRMLAAQAIAVMGSDAEKMEFLAVKTLESTPLPPEHVVRAIHSLKSSDKRDPLIVDLLASKSIPMKYAGGLLLPLINNDELRDRQIALLFEDASPAFRIPGKNPVQETTFRKMALDAVGRISNADNQQALMEKALNDTDLETRRYATTQLGAVSDQAFRSKWVRRMLSESTPSVVEAAAHQIKGLRDDATKATLIMNLAKQAQMNQVDFQKRAEDLPGLRKEAEKILLSKAPFTVEQQGIIARFQTVSQEVEAGAPLMPAFRTALRAVNSLNSDQFKLPIIEALSTHPDVMVRASLAESISSIQEEAKRPGLIKSMADEPVFTVRDGLVKAVASIQTDAIRASLIQELSDMKSSNARIVGATVTRLMPGDEAREKLIRTLMRDAHPLVREALARHSVDSLPKGKSRDALVLSLSTAKDASLRLRAAEMLSTVSDEGLKVQLLKELFNPLEPKLTTPKVRAAVVKTVATLTNPVLQTKYAWDACTDIEPEVRIAGAALVPLAQNIGVRNQMVTRLTQDDSTEVRIAGAAQLGHASRSVRLKLAEALLQEKDEIQRSRLAWAIYSSTHETP